MSNGNEQGIDKGKHQTINAALRFSPEWKAWEKHAYDQGWDWAETNDTGWMSDGHFAAFMEFVRKTKRVSKTETHDITEIEEDYGKQKI